jgi:hypothetical protein
MFAFLLLGSVHGGRRTFADVLQRLSFAAHQPAPPPYRVGLARGQPTRASSSSTRCREHLGFSISTGVGPDGASPPGRPARGDHVR